MISIYYTFLLSVNNFLFRFPESPQGRIQKLGEGGSRNTKTMIYMQFSYSLPEFLDLPLGGFRKPKQKAVYTEQKCIIYTDHERIMNACIGCCPIDTKIEVNSICSCQYFDAVLNSLLHPQYLGTEGGDIMLSKL